MSQRFYRNILSLWLTVLILFIYCKISLAYIYRNCDAPAPDNGTVVGDYFCSGCIDNEFDLKPRWHCDPDELIIDVDQNGNMVVCKYVSRDSYTGRCLHRCYFMCSMDITSSYSGETCPQSAVFCHVGGKKCEAKGCSISVWQDSNGKCGNIVTTNCSAEDIEYCNNNNAWDADVRVCITGNNEDDFQQALQDIWSHKCCYSYTDWRNRDEIKNMKYFMVDNYDPNKDKEVPQVDFNATNSTVVVAPSGGITGNANVENATTADLADYLAAIQANTAAIAANLEKLNLTGGIGSGSGSTGVYIGSGSGSGSTNGSGSGNVTIDWGEGEVEALTQEDFNTDIDVPGDIEAMGNATYGEGVSDVIENMPIISALRGSGVDIQDVQCAITGEVYGHTYTIDFCSDTISNMLNLMGTIIYGVSIFVFFFIVFTF